MGKKYVFLGHPTKQVMLLEKDLAFKKDAEEVRSMDAGRMPPFHRPGNYEYEAKR